ncbi:MAG TPA: 50S ribosomal protein L30 [Longimicrobiales bacterium]|nr:50S ribosomal protein L30 [Longimicrobiales bacterium]
MAQKKVKVTLRKSVIGEKPKTRATVESLGLKRIRHTVEHVDTPTLRGMIHRVRHLVNVEEE